MHSIENFVVDGQSSLPLPMVLLQACAREGVAGEEEGAEGECIPREGQRVQREGSSEDGTAEGHGRDGRRQDHNSKARVVEVRACTSTNFLVGCTVRDLLDK